MSNILVILDDGHGMDSAGKRTPYIPELGRHIKENEFNRVVVKLIADMCSKEEWTVLETAPEIDNVSLRDRVTRANQVHKDFNRRYKDGVAVFVSIHYNAHKTTFEASNAQGIETFHLPGSSEGGALARMVHSELKEGTPQLDRGVKTALFYVLKYTTMPAILVEAGFMDDEREARLMLDKDFQLETATEVFNGIKKYVQSKVDTDPEWIRILRRETDSPEAWINFIDEMKEHPMGKWMPALILKIGGKL